FAYTIIRITLTTQHYHTHSPATSYLCPFSLHDALPISPLTSVMTMFPAALSISVTRISFCVTLPLFVTVIAYSITSPISYSSFPDRKSTRLNSSHVSNSYAVFCLNKDSHLTKPKYLRIL